MDDQQQNAALLRLVAAEMAEAATSMGLASAHLGAAATFAAARHFAAAAAAAQRRAPNFLAAFEERGGELEGDLGRDLFESANSSHGLPRCVCLPLPGAAPPTDAEDDRAWPLQSSQNASMAVGRLQRVRGDCPSQSPPYLVPNSNGRVVHISDLPSSWRQNRIEEWTVRQLVQIGLERNCEVHTSPALDAQAAIVFFAEQPRALLAQQLLGGATTSGEGRATVEIYSAKGYVVRVSRLPPAWALLELAKWLGDLLGGERAERPGAAQFDVNMEGGGRALLSFCAPARAKSAREVIDGADLPDGDYAEADFWTPPLYDPWTADPRFSC